MHSGKAGAPVSLFVQMEGRVFLSGKSNMLILLGRGLECLYFSKKNCIASPQHHQPHADNQVCVDVIVSPVSKLSFPTSFGALAHCFSASTRITWALPKLHSYPTFASSLLSTDGQVRCEQEQNSARGVDVGTRFFKHTGERCMGTFVDSPQCGGGGEIGSGVSTEDDISMQICDELFF